MWSSHRRRSASAWLAVGLAVLVGGCEADRPTEPEAFPAFGRSGSGGPTVSSTNPSEAPQDTTLDVRVLGSGFDQGSRAEWAVAGVPSPKVITNSTRFVSSKELVANIKIVLDADTVLYDVLVTTSRGKKGIGTELFKVKPGGPKPPPPPPPPADPAIAFIERTANSPDKLVVINSDGSNRTTLVEGSVFGHPSWSPDARSIVFNGGIGGSGGIWIIDVAVTNGVPTGSNLRRVPITLPAGSAGEGRPDWSPTGDLIVFTASGSGTNYDRSLYVVPPSGGIATVIHTSGPAFFPAQPDWSPDASSVVFFDNEISSPYRHAVLILHLGTAQVDTIVPLNSGFGENPPRFPAWSHDGTRIAFSASTSTQPEGVYLVAATPGASPARVVDGGMPTWAPDDSRLALVSSGLVTFTLGTGAIQQLLAGNHVMPDWRRF